MLVPIVYNAVAQKPNMRDSGLFRALHAAMKRSKYWGLLKPPAQEPEPLPRHGMSPLLVITHRNAWL